LLLSCATSFCRRARPASYASRSDASSSLALLPLLLLLLPLLLLPLLEPRLVVASSKCTQEITYTSFVAWSNTMTSL
jgi:hypothetical protein